MKVLVCVYVCGLAPPATPVSGTLCLTCMPGLWQALGASANSWVPGPTQRVGTNRGNGDLCFCESPALAQVLTSILSGPERSWTPYPSFLSCGSCAQTLLPRFMKTPLQSPLFYPDVGPRGAREISEKKLEPRST